MKLLTDNKNLIVVIAVAILVLLFLQTTVWGGRKTLLVRSGSMEPNIRTGSLVFSGPKRNILSPFTTAQFAIEDVIVFKSNDGKLITHRIVNVFNRGDNFYYQTKGDANNSNDGSLVAEEAVLGKVFFTLPYAGRVVNFAQSKKGYFLLVLLPSCCLMVADLFALFDEIKKKSPRVNLAKTIPLLLLLFFFMTTIKPASAYFSSTATNVSNSFSAAGSFSPHRPWCGRLKNFWFWKYRLHQRWQEIAEKMYQDFFEQQKDFCQELTNQAITFHNNWQENPFFERSSFRDAFFDSQGAWPNFDGKSTFEIYNQARDRLNRCSPNNQQEKNSFEEITGVLESINDSQHLWYK